MYLARRDGNNAAYPAQGIAAAVKQFFNPCAYHPHRITVVRVPTKDWVVYRADNSSQSPSGIRQKRTKSFS